MKKHKKKHIMVVLLLFFVILFASACSENGSANTESTQAGENKEVAEPKTNSDDLTTADTTAVKEESNAEQEEKRKTFKHAEQNYSIDLDENIGDELIIEEGETTTIYYQDQALLKENVLIGTIYRISPDEWNNLVFEEKVNSYVTYDEDADMINMYVQEITNPYSEYVNELLSPSDEIPEDYINYNVTKELFLASILDSDFTYGLISTEQSMPKAFNQNQIAGIDISERMYQDIAGWYDALENNISNEMTLDEKGDEIFRILTEVQETYPELRQIPFPTFEIGANITHTLDLLRGWYEYPYFADEPNHLLIENQISVIGQFAEVIESQLEEIRNVS